MRKLLIILLLCTSAFGQFQQKPMLGQQVNWAHPQSKGLVFFMAGNEDSGNIVQDLSGNGKDGIFVGTIDWAAGRFGQCVDMVGVDAYIDISVALGTTFTIIADIYPQTMSTYSGIVTVNNLHGLFYQETEDKLTYYLSSNHYSDTVIPHDKWSQIALVRKETTIEFFLNGISDGTDTVANTAFTAEYVGSTNVGQDYKGKFGYFYFYNRALLASEIAELYMRPFCMVQQDDIAIMAKAAESPTGGQVIFINLSAISLLLIPALILIKRKKWK